MLAINGQTGYTDHLESENRRLYLLTTQLETELAKITRMYNLQSEVVQLAQQSGKLEIRLDENLPYSDGMYVPSEMAVNSIRTLTKAGTAMLDLAWLIGSLWRLSDQVDAIAAYCPITKLANALAGFDVKLSAAHTAMIGAARAADFEFPALSVISSYIAKRIEGIQRVPKDSGEYLRQVIAETASDFTANIQALADQTRQGPQSCAPETVRLAEYATEAKYEGERTWDDASLHILKELRRNQQDEIDRGILRDLEYYYSRSAIELTQYVKNTYHGWKRTR